MKTDTVTKLKFKQLKRRLRLPHWQVVGLLESIWRATEANAPAGNIGRLTDEEIAASIEWDGDPSELIASLVECRWLDRDDEFRLIVHDWSVHCPNHLRGGFVRQHMPFADQIAAQRNGESARHPSLTPKPSTPARIPSQAPQPPNLTKPDQTNPNQPTPLPPNGDADHGADPIQGGRAGGSRESGWGAVADDLTALNCSRWRETISEAKTAGCNPGLAREIIRYGKDHSYGIGAIVCRLVKARPTLPLAEGWPPPETAEAVATRKAETIAERKRSEQDESAATQIIKHGRRAKKTDDQIKTELAEAGLEWPK